MEDRTKEILNNLPEDLKIIGGKAIWKDKKDIQQFGSNDLEQPVPKIETDNELLLKTTKDNNIEVIIENKEKA